MAGIFVKFDDGIKAHYGTVLENLYSTSLKWVYESNPDDDEWPAEDITASLSRLQNKASKKGINIDYESSYLAFIRIWKFVLGEMNLPVPQLERIIPIVFSLWNTLKGGSDTLTKLMAHEDCRLPTKDPQAFAIGRMLKLILTAVHRMSQIMGAKDDINWYQDMLHYRNANNKRQSFHKLMVMVSRALT